MGPRRDRLRRHRLRRRERLQPRAAPSVPQSPAPEGSSRHTPGREPRRPPPRAPSACRPKERQSRTSDSRSRPAARSPARRRRRGPIARRANRRAPTGERRRQQAPSRVNERQPLQLRARHRPDRSRSTRIPLPAAPARMSRTSRTRIASSRPRSLICRTSTPAFDTAADHSTSWSHAASSRLSNRRRLVTAEITGRRRVEPMPGVRRRPSALGGQACDGRRTPRRVPGRRPPR